MQIILKKKLSKKTNDLNESQTIINNLVTYDDHVNTKVHYNQ
jgi:hypothetical protein